MKRIEFIAPVEAMRGNLSGNQVLEYPEQNNAAFEAPTGKRSYAVNYQPRFIGAKRAADNKKYYQVRTKSAIGLTNSSKLAMALLGASGAIRAAIKSQTTVPLEQIESNYELAKKTGVTSAKSMNAWIFKIAYESLKAKKTMINLSVSGATGSYAIRFKNPFISGITSATPLTISPEVLVKFWPQLANNPVVIKIEGQTMVAHAGDTFGTVAAASYNVLGVKILEIGNVKRVVTADSTTDAALYLVYYQNMLPNVITDEDDVNIGNTETLVWTEYPD